MIDTIFNKSNEHATVLMSVLINNLKHAHFISNMKFIINKPDYCNSLLYGVPEFQIQCLQKIVAHILTNSKRDIVISFQF